MYKVEYANYVSVSNTVVSRCCCSYQCYECAMISYLKFLLTAFVSKQQLIASTLYASKYNNKP